MKHGDLIVTNKVIRTNGIPHRRKAVVLAVSKQDIKEGIDALKPGLYAFYGFWYGNNPLDHKGFGKCVAASGRVVGRVRRYSPATVLHLG